HVFFFSDLPHGRRVIAVRVGYLTVFIKGATLHGRDQNRNASVGSRAVDEFLQISFVSRERSDAFALFFFVVVTILNEQVIARLHHTQNLVETLCSERTAQRFTRFCVIGNRDAGLEEARQHLSPTVVWLQWLIADGRVTE